MSKENDASGVSRRTVIATAAFVPLAALTSTAQTLQSSFTPAQRKTLEAFMDRLIPKDELGPGAVECGAADYVDKCMADYLAAEKPSFIEALAGIDGYAMKSQGALFAELPPEKRDAVITSMEAGTAEGFANARNVFNRVRRLTLEGMFSDPYYGGNKNFAGWDLIRYPGPRRAVGPDEQKMGVEIKPYRRSAYGDRHEH